MMSWHCRPQPAPNPPPTRPQPGPNSKWSRRNYCIKARDVNYPDAVDVYFTAPALCGGKQGEAAAAGLQVPLPGSLVRHSS